MMNIYVNKEILNKSLSNLEKNNQYFVIDENLFSIKNIDTLLKIKDDLGTQGYGSDLFDKTGFSFLYNGKKVEIIYRHENTLCSEFVKMCKLISEDDVNCIMEKAIKITEEKFKGPKFTIPSIREVDEIFYNEVLVFLASKINENDKTLTTDDFSSKYELYKERLENEISETQNLMKKLHDILLNIKIESK